MGNKNRNKNRNRNKLANANQIQGGAPISGFPITGNGQQGGGGWGVSLPGSKPATGQQPMVNPFIIPKQSGLNITSSTFPSNFFISHDLSTWRTACDQAFKMGYTMGYATMTTWVFQCSPFVQGLFERLGRALNRIKFVVNDKSGDEAIQWTAELCGKGWQMEMRREMLFSLFWGFTGLNFDPSEGRVYKYPMQDIDCINRLLRASTYAFYDGARFEDHDNLLFIQPSTSDEKFLGWMQTISRSFIQINSSKNNWLAAGKGVSYPQKSVGYPQNGTAIGDYDLTNPSNPLSPFNPWRQQAEDIAANSDPSHVVVYPYTLDDKGNVVKSINVDFEKPGTAANMHKVFQEFNADEKAEIQEMIFGRSLTNTTSGSGNRALGEVEEETVDKTVEDLAPLVVNFLNDLFKPKIAKFYSNFNPDNFTFATNIKKTMSPEDMVMLSTVVTQNGKRLTPKFFEANGVPEDFIEDGPVVETPDTETDKTDVKADLSAILKKKARLR